MDVINSNTLTDDQVRDHLDDLREEAIRIEGELRILERIIRVLEMERDDLTLKLQQKRNEASWYIGAMNL